ncbi:MAG: DUF4340 domain-containing protein [Thermodesulfobacteriota bacterium]|nr:DUF4340 domain-containing protein [Thermodesulfobacteriota bacterium]
MKKLIVPGLILLLLGIYFYIYEVKEGQKRKVAKEEEKKVFLFTPQNLEELQFKTKKGTIRINKEKGKWTINEPIVGNGDNESIEEILMILKNVEFERIIDEDADNLNKYGLHSPSLEITLKEKESPQSKRVILGDKNPTGTYVYLKKENSPLIMLLDTRIKDILDNDLYYYRDKRTLKFKREDIKRLCLKYNDGKAELALDEKGNWRIIDPIEAKADGRRIGGLLEGLVNSKVEEFIEERADDLNKYGLAHTNKEITFFTDQRDIALSLLLGNKKETSGNTYAKLGDAENVFLISEDSYKGYPNSLFDLMDKTVLDFKKEEIERIELLFSNEETVLRKEVDGHWNIIRPIKAKADDFEVNDLLEALSDIEAIGFLGNGSDLTERYNFKSPLLKISISQKNKTPPLQLAIITQGDYGKDLLARAGNGNIIYQLQFQTLDDLNKTSYNLRDRKLLSFDTEAVAKIQIKYPDKIITLTSHNGDWMAIEPKKKNLDNSFVISLLWDIRLLRFKEIIAENGKKPLINVFNRPNIEIALWDKKEKKIDSLYIGERSADKNIVYAGVGSLPTLYSVDAQFLEKIPKGIDDIIFGL